MRIAGDGMIDKTATVSLSDRAAESSAHSQTQACLCLVGGKHIVQKAMAMLLKSLGFRIGQAYAGEDAMAEAFLASSRPPADVIVLILSGVGPFGSFRRIHETLARIGRSVPLVVLSEQASRGQVYAAIRIGARAYVNLDADTEELVKAIDLASRDKTFLASDAAELLVNDISTAVEPSSRQRLPSTDLSRRETEVVQLLCEGLSSKEIARHLHISAKTVENHRYNIYRKCEVDSIAALMRHAIQQGMVSI